MKNLTIALALVFFGISATFADETPPLPSVARRTLVCDAWQYSSEARLWGCVLLPHEASVASGKMTDEVVQQLLEQIKNLEERVKKLESKE